MSDDDHGFKPGGIVPGRQRVQLTKDDFPLIRSDEIATTSEPRTSVEPVAGIVRRWLWKAERVHYAGTTRDMREQIVGLSFTEGRGERAARRAVRRLTPPADEAAYVEQSKAAVERDAERER